MVELPVVALLIVALVVSLDDELPAPLAVALRLPVPLAVLDKLPAAELVVVKVPAALLEGESAELLALSELVAGAEPVPTDVETTAVVLPFALIETDEPPPDAPPEPPHAARSVPAVAVMSNPASMRRAAGNRPGVNRNASRSIFKVLLPSWSP